MQAFKENSTKQFCSTAFMILNTIFVISNCTNITSYEDVMTWWG